MVANRWDRWPRRAWSCFDVFVSRCLDYQAGFSGMLLDRWLTLNEMRPLQAGEESIYYGHQFWVLHISFNEQEYLSIFIVSSIKYKLDQLSNHNLHILQNLHIDNVISSIYALQFLFFNWGKFSAWILFVCTVHTYTNDERRTATIFHEMFWKITRWIVLSMYVGKDINWKILSSLDILSFMHTFYDHHFHTVYSLLISKIVCNLLYLIKFFDFLDNHFAWCRNTYWHAAWPARNYRLCKRRPLLRDLLFPTRGSFLIGAIFGSELERGSVGLSL